MTLTKMHDDTQGKAPASAQTYPQPTPAYPAL